MKAKIVGLAVLMIATGFTGVAIAGHGDGWMAYHGPVEPSTRWDTSDKMFQVPNQAAVEKLYFNGFLLHNALWGLDVQLQGGTMMPPTVVTAEAALGFWRDCNEDGYIGARFVPASFGSFSVYPRAASLTPINEAICPPGSPYNPTNSVTNSPNGQIDEMRWVGPQAVMPAPPPPSQLCVPPSGNPVRICAPVALDTRTTTDRYDVRDDLSHVWFDWNYPGGRHVPDQRNGVTYFQTRDSDSTLDYVDGALGYRLSGPLGPTWTTKPNVGACDSPPVLLGGPNSRLPVADRGTCGLWPVRQAYRLVNDSADKETQASEAVHVFDTTTNSGGGASPCDDGFDQTIAGRRIAFANVEPRLHPNILVEGSLVGTYDNVNAGTANGQFTGQCTRNNLGLGGASEDEESEPIHNQVSEELSFAADQRYHALDQFGFEEMALDILSVRGTPQGFNSVPTWAGHRLWVMRPPRTGFGVVDEAYTTFYADVSCAAVRPTPTDSCATSNPTASAATAFPGGKQNAFTYGIEACSTLTTGASNINPATDWECSITVWNSERLKDQQPTRPIIGDKYDLWDVDCYDSSVTDLAPVRVGLGDCTADQH